MGKTNIWQRQKTSRYPYSTSITADGLHKQIHRDNSESEAWQMKTERMTVAAKLRLHKKLQAPARRRETGNQLAACDEIWQSRDIQHLLDCDKIRQSSDVQHLLHFWRNMAIRWHTTSSSLWQNMAIPWKKTSSSVQTRKKCVSVAT